MLLGYLTTKATCPPHVHAQLHTSAPISLDTRASALEKPTSRNHLGRAQASRCHWQSHNRQGLLLLDPTRSSPAPSANRLHVPPFLNTSSHRVSKKKLGKKLKKPFFSIYPRLPVPVPRPSTVFVQIILPSKRTGVSLKVSRRNWQETAPGEEKVNQLFKTNCNK